MTTPKHPTEAAKLAAEIARQAERMAVAIDALDAIPQDTAQNMGAQINELQNEYVEALTAVSDLMTLMGQLLTTKRNQKRREHGGDQ